MKKNIILICIIAIGSFLRFNNLSLVPPSASLDEVSIGYNAYSLSKTGVDEYGTKFPILLRAYDDWRPALYVYLVIPFIKLFGLNVVSVRLPSVILSILTIIVTYFLAKELFSNSRWKLEIGNWKLEIPEVTSLLLAISPWHVYISRLGHEVNAGLAFIIFAILFFIKAMNNLNKKFYLFIAVVFFSLSLYTYQSEKVFVPLIILVLGFVYRKSLLKIKKELLIFILLGIVLIIPMITSTLTPHGLTRFKGTSAFLENSLYRESAEKVLAYRNEGNIFGEILNNRRLVPIKIFAINYFSHFNPKFLFFNSGDESFKAPDIGLMYIWEFPFIIGGIVFLLRSLVDTKIKTIILGWLLIAFVAPSISTGAPHAMRAYNLIPIPQILVALGLWQVISFLKYKVLSSKHYVFGGLLYTFLLIFNISVLYFFKQYFYVFPKNQSVSFQYALSEAIPFVLKRESGYNKIVFSNRDNLYQSYMFFLFYSKYDPFLYQKQGGTKSGGFAQAHKFGKYEFRAIEWEKDGLISNTLFVGNDSDFPRDLKSKFFTNLDGKGVIEVVHNKEWTYNIYKDTAKRTYSAKAS